MFIQDCDLYMIINDKVYDSDTKKIGFILALMNDGDAASWKEQFIEEAITTSDVQNIRERTWLSNMTYRKPSPHMMPPETL